MDQKHSVFFEQREPGEALGRPVIGDALLASDKPPVFRLSASLHNG